MINLVLLSNVPTFLLLFYSVHIEALLDFMDFLKP